MSQGRKNDREIGQKDKNLTDVKVDDGEIGHHGKLLTGDLKV